MEGRRVLCSLSPCIIPHTVVAVVVGALVAASIRVDALHSRPLAVRALMIRNALRAITGKLGPTLALATCGDPKTSRLAHWPRIDTARDAPRKEVAIGRGQGKEREERGKTDEKLRHDFCRETGLKRL